MQAVMYIWWHSSWSWNCETHLVKDERGFTIELRNCFMTIWWRPGHSNKCGSTSRMFTQKQQRKSLVARRKLAIDVEENWQQKEPGRTKWWVMSNKSPGLIERVQDQIKNSTCMDKIAFVEEFAEQAAAKGQQSMVYKIAKEPCAQGHNQSIYI